MSEDTLGYVPADGESPVTTVDLTARTLSRAFPYPERQVGGAVRSLIEANHQRSTLNSRIASRLNAERPYNPSDLARAQMSWRSNFTTRPLATLLQRAYGRFPRAVADAKYLTSAELPKGTPGGHTKSELFRDRVTRFIRGEPKWKNLIDSLAWEDVCYGYTAAVWLDKAEWLPFALRQDEVFLPVGCGQATEDVPFFAFRQNMLPHAAVDLLEKVEAAIESAAAAGLQPAYTWYPEVLAAAITDAIRDDSSATTSTTEDIRRLVDLRRQLANTNTLGSGRKVVPLYHVFAVELTGAVSHYIVDRHFRLVYEWLDEYDSLRRCVTFFAFEHGDATMHGSKGIGRLAYNVAAVQDRSTNDVCDRLHMAGKLFIKSPAAKHRTFSATMRGGFCLIDPDFEPIPALKLDAGVEESMVLDGFLEAKLDAMVGTVSPRVLQGERVTAAAVNLMAGRESDRSDDYLGRWLPQVGELVTEIVRRACLDQEIRDPRAMALRSDLLGGGLSPDEVAYLATQPAMTTLSGWTGLDRQQVIVACAEGRGNPVYDQRALEQAKLEAQVGPGFAESVLAPTPDPSVLAEQTRLQLMENMVLTQGMPVPVSLRDNHAVHLSGLLQVIQGAIQESVRNPGADQILVALTAHARAHLDLAGTDPAVQQFVPVVAELEQAVAQLQQAAAEQAVPEPAPEPGTEPTPEGVIPAATVPVLPQAG
jgi:hypothetical protein